MKLAPNLEVFFTDRPVEERIARIADMGFTGADMFFIEDRNAESIGKACEKHGVTISMVVGTDLKKALNDRSLHGEIEKRVRNVAEKAAIMRATNVVVLSGDTLPKVPAATQNAAITDGLKRLIPIAERFQVTIVLEMLNSLYDHPGYYLDDTERLFDLIRIVNHPRIKGLYDLYHAGIMRGNIVEDVRAGIKEIGHFHLAGIPGRHEPKDGEQNYPFICKAIDAAGYKGFIGLEYWPVKESVASLQETQSWLQG
jgi:hydroxypyruvate isomerase